jgi:hypothetical protein
VILVLLAPEAQVDEFADGGEHASGGLGACGPLAGRPQDSHLYVLGDVDSFGGERGVASRCLVDRPLPASVVVDVHGEPSLVQAGHEADHAAVPGQDLAGSQEVLQLRVDSRLRLAEAVHYQVPLAPHSSAADDCDVFLAGVLVSLGHVLSLLRGDGVCTQSMLGRRPLRATKRRGCCHVP